MVLKYWSCSFLPHMLYAPPSSKEMLSFHGSCIGKSFHIQGDISWVVTKQGRDQHSTDNIFPRTKGDTA